MNREEKKKCHWIIHIAATTAGVAGAGLAQLPLADAVPITSAQVGMIISLGAVFGKEIDKSVATSILTETAAVIGGRTASQFLAGLIPGIGNVINASTAALITEGIGWAVANNFDQENQQKKLEKQQYHKRHKRYHRHNNPEVVAATLALEEEEQKTRTWPAVLATVVVIPAILLLLCYFVDMFGAVGIKTLGLSNSLNLTILGLFKIALVVLIDVLLYLYAKIGHKININQIRQIISYSNLMAAVASIRYSIWSILKSDELSSKAQDIKDLPPQDS